MSRDPEVLRRGARFRQKRYSPPHALPCGRTLRVAANQNSAVNSSFCALHSSLRICAIFPPMLPYLTPEFPGVGGAIKQRSEDFFVQEIPLYEPSGEGEHVYCEIQKIGLTTFDAMHQLGKALDISTREIGYAGMKDAHAITRQVFSIAGTTPEAVMALRLPNITIQWAARHGNKLRLGHLQGNRFAIKIREVLPTDVVKLKPVLDIIQKRGMPNFFGEQRFGRRNNNDLLGAALIRGDHETCAEAYCLDAPNPESGQQANV